MVVSIECRREGGIFCFLHEEVNVTKKRFSILQLVVMAFIAPVISAFVEPAYAPFVQQVDCLRAALGYVPWSFDPLIWHALWNGFVAGGVGTVAHTRKL